MQSEIGTTVQEAKDNDKYLLAHMGGAYSIIINEFGVIFSGCWFKFGRRRLNYQLLEI